MVPDEPAKRQSRKIRLIEIDHLCTLEHSSLAVLLSRRRNSSEIFPPLPGVFEHLTTFYDPLPSPLARWNSRNRDSRTRGNKKTQRERLPASQPAKVRRARSASQGKKPVRYGRVCYGPHGYTHKFPSSSSSSSSSCRRGEAARNSRRARRRARVAPLLERPSFTNLTPRS